MTRIASLAPLNAPAAPTAAETDTASTAAIVGTALAAAWSGLAASAAVLIALAAPVAAQDAEPGMAGTVETRDAAHLQRVDGIRVDNTAGDRIATVESILIDGDGAPAGFLLDLGELLDFTGSTVEVPLGALTWNGAHYVSTMTEQQLQNLEPFDE